MSNREPLKVLSRDDKLREFDINRIASAIAKAFDATGTAYTNDVLAELSVQVLANAQRKISDNTLKVEDIQDSVIRVLIKRDFDTVADAYESYRNARADVRTIRDRFAKEAVYNYTDFTAEEKDKHVKNDRLSVNHNASTGYSFGGLVLNLAGRYERTFWFSEVFSADPRIRTASDNGTIYIHDGDYLTAYCAGWSLKDLILEGIVSVGGKNASAPAKHLSTLCNQMVNFLGIMQNEWAGAQAFSSFDTYLAPFVKVDNLTYKQTKQCVQSFVYGLNTPSRWGTQAPFTNITLDWTVPADMKNLPALVGGKEQDFTYGDCQGEMDMVNKAFLEVMTEGDCDGRSFSYPIPTYNITKDFDWTETENLKLLFELSSKYGVPYFSNYINSDMNPSDVRSMCCRLRLDLRELRNQNGGNFGAGENTGSIGVVTINLPRAAYLAESEADFFARLDEAMDIAASSLDLRRKFVTQMLEQGLYPYTRHYLKAGFKNHFSTIGLVGMNEACLNAKWIGKDLTAVESRTFALMVLDHMRERLSDYQEQYGCLFNLEATPAESTCYKLARGDRKEFPDIITAGKSGETPYYTNSTHLPVGKVGDIFEALSMEDDMQTKYTSGTVFHAFLGERIGWKEGALLVKTIANNFKLPYFTLSPTYSVCEEHGYIKGEEKVCPVCGKPTEIFSRITGYYRPVSNWNDGKRQEFEDRKTYDPESFGAEWVAESDSESGQDTASSLALENGVYLFTTPTCPNCRQAKQFLGEAGVEYKEMDATAPDNLSLVQKIGIMTAPTLVVVKNGFFETRSNVSDIRGWIESR